MNNLYQPAIASDQINSGLSYARAAATTEASTTDVVTLRPPPTIFIAKGVVAIVGTLLILGIIAAFLRYQAWVFFGDEQFQRLFYLDRELGVPATISVLGLAACSLVLALLAATRHHGGYGFGRYWLVLAIGFAYLAVDEGAAVHETLDGALNGLAFTSEYGFLSRPWVLAGALAAIVVGLLYVPFLLHLPRRFGIGMLVAGAMYVGGSVGAEMLGAQAVADEASIRYFALTVAEETLEMSGIGLFLVLLWSLVRQTPWRLESPALERPAPLPDGPLPHEDA